jgi:outer membrane protein assembly factor BamA
MTAVLLALALAAGAEPQEPKDETVPVASALGFEWGLLPAIDYSSDFGLGLGAIGTLSRTDPARALYVYQLQAQIYANTGGQQYHYLSVDIPAILDSPYRLVAQVAYDLSRFSPWYGIGNHAPPDPSEPDRYYQFDRLAPTGRLQVRRQLNTWLHVFLQYHFTWTRIGLYPGSLAQTELPPGSSGGRYAEASAGLLADTRDNEISPTHGELVELALRGAHPILGSRYATAGAYAGVSVFRQPWERLVLAGRLAFDQMWGDVPFDQLQDIGVAFPQQGLGGATTVRGLLQSEYVGDTKLLLNLEARLHLVGFSILGQQFKLGVLAFLDSGRVWARGYPDPPGLHIRAGTGGGIRLTWGRFLVIRFDTGVSQGQVRFYADVNQIF